MTTYSPLHFLRLVGISLLGLSILGGTIFAAYFTFTGITGAPHIDGVFFSDGRGNAGSVSFDHTPLPSDQGRAGLIGGTSLTGSFYLQTVGWVVFDSDARIHPPASGNATDLWSISGNATSHYAGKIYLNTGSYRTEYDPINRSLSGSAWNLGVGRIPFGSAMTRVIGVDDPIDPDIIHNTDITRGFIGSVKVIGTVGGKTNYDTFYNIGAKLNLSLFTERINLIRQNVALLMRNLPSQYENTIDLTNPKILDDKVFFINQSPTARAPLVYTDHIKTALESPSNKTRSVIIMGYDLIIDSSISNTDIKKQPKGIIVLKNKNGIGGNIIINATPRIIQASLITEGSIYSGNNPTSLYSDNTESVAHLSETASGQLYIRGSVFSRNTIGGAIQTPIPTCVYGENNCTYSQAIRYDLNYFRGFRAGDASRRAYVNDSLDAYSVIIEFDPSIIMNPPPGF